MRHINILKKTIHITAVLFLSLAFFACGNGTNEINKAETKSDKTTGITVKGKISINGAGPSYNLNRSATFSMPETITWVITAETSDYEEGVSGATAYYSTTSVDYEITFPTSGAWNITVNGYEGLYGDNDGDDKADIPDNKQIAFSGSLPEVSISEDGSEEPLDISVYTNKTSGTGIVSLAISDTSGKINNGIVVFTSKLGDFQPIIKEFTFTNGQTSVQESEVQAGYYTVDLTFEDRIGNVLYACKESVNVYEGLTTNTWYGSAPYLSDDAFVITQELLDAYGAETVPSTSNVIYTAVSEAGVNTYSYYLTENITLDPEHLNSIAETKLNYCFDNDGYFYTFIYDLNDGYKVISSKYEEELDIPAEINDLNGITIDRKTNVLYAWFGNGLTYDIYKFPNLISSGTTEYVSVSGGDYSHINQYFDHSNTTLIINDGIMYTFTSGDEVSTLRNKKLYVVDTAETSPKAKQITLDYESAGLTESDIDSLKITDIIYQDGVVYLLARDVSHAQNNSISYCTSRGALISYNTLTRVITTHGLSTSVKQKSDLSETKIQLYYGGWVEGEYRTLPLYDGEQSNLVYISADTNILLSDVDTGAVTDETAPIYEAFPVISSPSPLSEQLSDVEFYGPVRFIAVKPKKLVIADDGVAFYTNADGVLKYKNVNRVVTVDLDSFSMISENVGVSFNNDDTDIIECLNCNSTSKYCNALNNYYQNINPYYQYAGQDEQYLTNTDYSVLGIPCDDSE